MGLALLGRRIEVNYIVVDLGFELAVSEPKGV